MNLNQTIQDFSTASYLAEKKQARLNAVSNLTNERLSKLTAYGSSNCMNLQWAMMNFRSPDEFRLYIEKLESTLTA